MKLLSNLNKNLTTLKKTLVSHDIEFLSVSVCNKKACLIFIKDIADKNAIGELILKPLSELTSLPNQDDFLNSFFAPEKTLLESQKEVYKELVKGSSILLINGFTKAFSFSLKKLEKRAITEPPTSTVIKGPREGFVESLPVNVSLMRRRIISENLIFENMVIGKYTNTSVSICYIKGIADERLVKQLKKDLKDINIDAILDSSYVAKFLGRHKQSVFRQVGTTEKPDILTAKIMEGRVAIFVDGSPIVLTVPYLIVEDFQSPSDYYNSPYTATLSRLLRLFSVMIAIILPAFFVSAELFHLQLIPLSFLLTIINSIKGIPLSPSYEMFFTILIFEILNETSIRMPKYVGMVISIVGGLVLGETAVNAGVISAPTLMIIALSGICLYTVPELEKNFSVIRLLFLIIGGTCGAYGILLAIAFLLVYLVSFENYGVPLLAPFSPLVTKDLKDSFIKGFLIEHGTRPLSLKNKNKTRLKVKND